MNLREVYRRILATCAQSAIVTGVQLLLLDEPILKLRIHLGMLAFIGVFLNAETEKTSFALIKEKQRIFGSDNTCGWHVHPFDSPESHHPCEEMSFESFLSRVEQYREKWKPPPDNGEE